MKCYQYEEHMRHKLPRRDNLICFLYILFLLQDCFLKMGISIFGYYDEILAILCGGLAFLNIIRNHFVLKEQRFEIVVLVSYWIFILIGLASNLINSDQTILYVLLDILTSSKMLLGIAGAKVVFANGVNEKLKNGLLKITIVYIVCLFFLAIHDWFFSPFFEVGYDNTLQGIASKYLYLIYSNPTYLAAYAIAALIVFVYTEKKNTPRIFLIMNVVVIVLTTRSKALGFVCIAFLLYWVTDKAANVKSIWNRLLVIIPTGITAALFVAMDKIILYFFTPSHYSPRSILLNAGISRAKEYFPLGNGFGTFCSVAAITTGKGTNLLPYNKTAYYDAFWACITGQFGFLGTVAFVVMILALMYGIMSLIQYDRKSWYAAIFSMLYLLIASLGETSFFSPYSVGYGILIGMALSCRSATKKGSEL